ncbi:MAG: YceD family protein, partial [Lysobacterales bacterium]
GKRVFSGTIPLKRMKRLATLLVNTQGEVSFTAAFRTDLEQRIVIDLQVEAALPLVCQASLEVYDEQVNRSSELVVIDDDSEQFKLPDNYDPVVTENGRLAIASLVEDELLLGLPQIPRKPGLQVVEYSTGGQALKTEALPEGSKKNPFSALQDMLEREK